MQSLFELKTKTMLDLTIFECMKEKAIELLSNSEKNQYTQAIVLCIWQDQCIDIPSFAFRNLLLDLNEKNSESTLFIMTTDGVSGIKLSATMK